MSVDPGDLVASQVIDKPQGSNGGAKAIGVILMIVALIMGVYAMVEPMNQRIDFLENQLRDLRESYEASEVKHADMHSIVSANIARLEGTKSLHMEKHEELKNRIVRIENWDDTERMILIVDAQRELAELRARIDVLEQQ